MDSPKKIAEFDNFAGSYDLDLEKGISVSGEDKDYFANGRVKLLAMRLLQIGISPLKILDFGCGTGSAIPFLRSQFPQALIVGADVSQKSIEIAEQIHKDKNVQFILLENLRLDQSFDLVFCNGVFHHIPKHERPAAIETIRAVLRTGGCFALWENNPWNPGTRLVMSRIPFDRDADPMNPLESKRMLVAGKFQIARIDFAFYFPKILKLFRCFEPMLFKIPLGAQFQMLATNETLDK
jgi:SAM-dependent methyltransferase